MNDRHGSRTAAVGLVISIALVILAGSILMIGSESRMFAPKSRYNTNFRSVLGLRVGSPVYMSGVQVGGVESIELPTNPSRQGIPVTLAVDRKYAERVREGTRASLAFLQVLSGDKLVILTPGDSSTPALPEGASIPPDESATLLEAGASAAENLNEITAKLNGILEPIERGEGLLGKMIRDPNFGQEGLANINETFVEAREILRKLNEGQGLAGKLLFDREYARTTLDSLQQSLRHLGDVLDRIDNNEGALGSLLQEGGEGEIAITEIKNSARDLRGILEDLRGGKGLLSKMIYDEEFSRKLAEDLKRSSSSLASILQKIDKGEGSLGALINDPKVYQGLNDLVGGVRGSAIGRGLVHHYQKKGANRRKDQEQKTGEGQQTPGEGQQSPPPKQAPAPPPAPSPETPSPTPWQLSSAGP